MLELGEFFVRQNRRFEFNQPAALRLRIEQIALAANRRFGRRDQFFANAINGRIGYLGEKLLEIVVERLRLVREHRERRVRAHGTNRLGPVARHRRHNDAQILERVAKGLLAL